MENQESVTLSTQGAEVTELKTPLHNYPKILNLGHKLLADLFKGTVLVEEKVDGSQFSFGKKNGELFFRSRGGVIYPETAQKLFKSAVDYIIAQKEQVIEGLIYRGEVLHKPKHNTLSYGRVPNNNIAIFDIEYDSGQNFMPYNQKFLVAQQLGLETVPCFFSGEINDIEELRKLLETESFLGGCKLEGVVIKNYNQFGVDQKVLMGKWVREEFKEAHQGEWKKSNPTKNDLIESLINVYATPERWEKAIQHLRDAGQLQNAPQDIGLLLKEINSDTLIECETEIREKLFEYAWPKIARGLGRGFAEYYKDKLAESQFEAKGDSNAKA